MTTLISAVIVFSLLIFFHELGHFSVAKLVGVKVHEFAIGMGPKLLKHKKGETTYSLRALPIGGFVMMEGEMEASDDEKAFNKKPIWARMAVFVAGAVMNFVLGFIIFVILTLMQPVVTQPVIGELTPGLPAEKAGLLPGDRIIKLNDYKVHIQNDVRYFLDKNGDKPVDITVLRTGEKLIYRIVPEYDPGYQSYMIGYTAKGVPKNLLNVPKNAFYQTVFYSKVIVKSLVDLVTGREALNQLSGPVGMVQGIGTAARSGFESVALLAAFISINLGIFNLLPIPALDGSKILFLLVAGIRRKPIDPEKEGIITVIGFGFLILLLIYATFNDILRITGH